MTVSGRSRPTGFVPALDPSSGGMYQYGLALVKALEQLDPEGVDHLLLIRGRGAAPDLGPWPTARLESTPQALWRQLMDRAGKGEVEVDRLNRRTRTSARLRRMGIDLMVFAAPDPLAVELGLPFVMPVHDLQHRLQPQFPEVSMDGEWERREYLYVNAARARSVLLVDSEVGREDALDCYGEYGLTTDRVEIFPFLPSPSLDTSLSKTLARVTCDRLGAPSEFFFYPAQFWPHKGHLSLVKGLALARGLGVSQALVLVGSNSGALRTKTFDEVMQLAEDLGVADGIHYLGYVTDDEMSALYREALALVMPTYFGPTNIPVVEAWAFGCPVMTSAIRGVREQAAGAALLVDPDSPPEIAEGLRRLIDDGDLRASLVSAGHEKLHGYTSLEHGRLFAEILRRARERLVG